MDASRAALRAGCAAFLAFGSTTSVLGPILPGIRHDLHAGDVASGAFVGLAGGGFGIGVLASAPIQHRWSRRHSYRLGLLSLVVGATLIAIAPTIIVATAGATVASFGGGLLGGAVNAAMAELGTSPLAVSNAVFSIGAIVGPLATATLIGIGGSWRIAPLLGLVLSVAALPLGRHLPDRALADTHGGGVVRRLMSSRAFLLLVAVISLQILGEAGLIGWLPVYLVDGRGGAEWLGAVSIMVFWTGQAIARSLMTRVHATSRPARAVPFLQLALVAAALGVLVTPTGMPVIAVSLLAGIAAGPVFPLILMAVRTAFPADLDAATAVLLGAGGLTEMLLPLALGSASSLAGTTAAGIVAVATAFALAAVVASRAARAQT